MALILAVLIGPAIGLPATTASAGKAIEYLRGRQNEDGGFAEPDAASDPRTTCWVILAASAAGEQPMDWSKAGVKPGEFLVEAANQLSTNEDLLLLVMAVASSGGDPRNAAGIDLIAILQSGIAPDGKIGADIRQHCLGSTALAAAGVTVPPESARWLLGQQRADGGWGESDRVLASDTALAVEALVASEEGVKDNLDRAMKLLRDRMNPDGGFSGPSRGSDAQTTATVSRAISAMGQDPSSREWSFHGNSPTSYLRSLQAADGHYLYSKGVESQPVMTTSMVIPAMARVHFPLGAANSTQAGPESNPVTSAGEQGTGAGDGDGGPEAGTRRTGSGAALGRAGAVGSTSGRVGLWLFVGICAAYSVMLLVAAVMAGRLAERARGKKSASRRSAVTRAPGAW